MSRLNLWSPALVGVAQAPVDGNGPDGTDYYVEVTIQSSEVDSTLTDFPVYVDLSDLPAAFFTNVQSDGGDLRVTESDGTTRAPVDLVSIDTGGNTGELHFLASSLSSSSSTTYRIYYGHGSLSQPGVGATYGRNAVWNGLYQGVWHLEEDPSGTAPQMVDSSGRSYDGTTQGSMTSGDSVPAVLGQGLEGDGSDDAVTVTTMGALGQNIAQLTFSGWFKSSDTTNGMAFFGTINDGSTTGISVRANEDRFGATQAGWFLMVIRDENGDSLQVVEEANTGLTDGNWHYVAVEARAGVNEADLWIDGSLRTTTEPLAQTPNTFADFDYPMTIMGLNLRGVMNRSWNGVADEVRIGVRSQLDFSTDRLAAEYSNQNTPGTFYSIGSQQTA